MPKVEIIISILARYQRSEFLSEEELIIMQDWLSESEANQQLFEDLSNPDEWERQVAELESHSSDATWERIKERIHEKPVVFHRHTDYRKWIAAAAIILGLIFGAWYFIFTKKKNEQPELAYNHDRYKNDVLPGGNHATLTTANGSVIILDSVPVGVIANSITKKDSATLDYSDQFQLTALQYNTLATPEGGEYQVILPDSTHVWLNAASSLKYPLAFTGNTRTVELTGEAYFEVTKNKLKPFIVQSKLSYTKVFGTHFDIKSYADETSRTTLLEGSIAIKALDAWQLIKPGEQATIVSPGKINISIANMEEVSAWRNKLFWFNEAPFDQIMKELSRWYNIDVVFSGNPVTEKFTGILPRDMPLSVLFGILEKNQHVHFSIEGKKVTVSN